MVIYHAQFALLCHVILSFKLHHRSSWTGNNRENLKKILQACKWLGLWHSEGAYHPSPASPYSVMPLNLQSTAKQGLVQDQKLVVLTSTTATSIQCVGDKKRKGIRRQNALLGIGQCVQSPTHQSDQIRIENNKTIII